MPVAVGPCPDAGAASADATKSSALTSVVPLTLPEICLPDMPDMPDTRDTRDTRDMAPAIPRPVGASPAAMDMGKQRLAGRVRPTGVCHQPAQGCRDCR